MLTDKEVKVCFVNTIGRAERTFIGIATVENMSGGKETIDPLSTIEVAGRSRFK